MTNNFTPNNTDVSQKAIDFFARGHIDDVSVKAYVVQEGLDLAVFTKEIAALKKLADAKKAAALLKKQ